MSSLVAEQKTSVFDVIGGLVDVGQNIYQNDLQYKQELALARIAAGSSSLTDEDEAAPDLGVDNLGRTIAPGFSIPLNMWALGVSGIAAFAAFALYLKGKK